MKWNSNDVPGQEGKIVIVTGSSSGIGLETARVLASKGAGVVIAVRNREKGYTAAESIKRDFPGAKAYVMELDLADLESVKGFAKKFKAQYKKLDLLINNAGVMMPPYSKTADGFELQMGTNHFGHFALTGLLLDILIKTKESRIVTVSSMAHRMGNIEFSDLNWEIRKYNASKAYGDSKIANLYFTYELARRMESGRNVPLVAAAHPGWTATDLQRHSSFYTFMNRFFAQKPHMGALPTLYAVVAPDVQSGDFFGPDGFLEMRGYPKKVESDNLSRDASIAEKLWEVSEELTGVKYNP